MKIVMNPFCIICSIIFIILHTAFAIPTTLSPSTHNNEDQESTTLEVTTLPTSPGLTPSPPTSVEEEEEEDPTKIITPQQVQGRNIRFPSAYEDVIVLAPIQDSLDSPDYRKQIVGFEQFAPPYALGYDDTVYDAPVQYETAPTDFKNNPAIIYPAERFRDGDMATAESNIVFRPLFTYRRQVAQRRRVYTQPSSSSSSSSSSSYPKKEQRRPYRYPVYYTNYPGYYVNAQYDYVP